MLSWPYWNPHYKHCVNRYTHKSCDSIACSHVNANMTSRPLGRCNSVHNRGMCSEMIHGGGVEVSIQPCLYMNFKFPFMKGAGLIVSQMVKWVDTSCFVIQHSQQADPCPEVGLGSYIVCSH